MALVVGVSAVVEWPVPSALEVDFVGRAGARPDSQERALIVYHPSWVDRFQEELTKAFGEGLVDLGWGVDRISVAGLSAPLWERIRSRYRLVAFGANTYYWRPDLPTRSGLKRINLKGVQTVGWVSGAGSTARAERLLGEQIRVAGGALLWTRSFWLWRPNDESRLHEPNRQVALEQVRQAASQLAPNRVESAKVNQYK